ncbi:MAG: hypothetical protein ACXQS5_05390 [Candidatus Methanospirareceae archaeon]
MTLHDEDGEYILPREITFSGLELPAKRAVSVIFEDGTERAVTFYFTHLDYSDERLVEVYWWEGDDKIVGFEPSIIEEMCPFEVKHPDTGIMQFIVLPRLLNAEEVVDNHVKTVKMSPRLWIYEVDAL